jgi:hypothetical protein
MANGRAQAPVAALAGVREIVRPSGLPAGRQHSSGLPPTLVFTPLSLSCFESSESSPEGLRGPPADPVSHVGTKRRAAEKRDELAPFPYPVSPCADRRIAHPGSPGGFCAAGFQTGL